MKKIEILKQVAEVMKIDAACCKDIKDEVLPKYEALINEEMSDNDFLLTINSYLCTFSLTGHLFFKKQGNKGLPFRVHRYENVLYVTDVTKDSNLDVGDKIVKIDGYSIKDFYKKYEEFFFQESQERQTPHWNFILKFANQIGYIKQSEEAIKYWEVELFEWNSEFSPYTFKKINNSTVYLKMEDFVDPVKISSLCEKYDSEIRTSKNLIVDVRGNSGGNGISYYPLLKYCLPNGKTLGDLDLVDNGVLQYGQEILYTERNCDIRIEIIEELMQNDLSAENQDFFKQAINELRELRGTGFVKDLEADDIDIAGDSCIEHVYLLTDSSCCSAGDAFVYLFKMLPKVKVFGRPTKGILDYSNVAYALFDEYALIYPTSRLLSLDYGKGMMKSGVMVDEYIEWTPNHLKKDVDLEYVLKLIDIN